MDPEGLLEQFAEHDAVVEQGAGDDLDDQRVFAYALMGRARCLAHLGRGDEAMRDWAAVRQRFGESSDGDLRAHAAAASVRKGWMLHNADQLDEALVAYEDAYALANGRDERALQVQVVAALYRKALVLSALEFSSDAIRTLAELIDNYGDDPPSETLPDLADAMLLVAPLACVLGQPEQAFVAWDQLIARFGNNDNENIRETIGRARIGRANLLGQQGHVSEAIQSCQELLADIGETPEGLLVAIRALALVECADWLQAAGRHDAAMATYQSVVDGFNDGQDPETVAALARAQDGLAA